MIIIRRVRPKQANFGLVNAIKEPFRRYGRHIGKTIQENANVAAARATKDPTNVSAAKDAAAHRIANDWAKKNPGKLGAIGLGMNAAVIGAGVGAGLAIRSFTRRRRTKNGKIVVEQVNRK